VPKILVDELYTGIVRKIPGSVCILVEYEEPALRTQFFEDCFGMPASSEGAVHISTRSIDLKSVQAFLEKNGNMIGVG
jgi:hypothetical protein